MRMVLCVASGHVKWDILRVSTMVRIPEEFSSMSDSMFTLFRCFVTDGCVSYEAWLNRDERCGMLLVSAEKVGHLSVFQKKLRGWHSLAGEAAKSHGRPVLHHVHFDYDESWHILFWIFSFCQLFPWLIGTKKSWVQGNVKTRN